MEQNTASYKRLLDMRLGMFVHYGIYSEMAGFWDGKPSEGLGEWIQLRAKIPNADYEAFAREHFRPKKDFARELVLAAKTAGVKYIVLTSKHHDGFCLFKTAVDKYNTYDFYGRDLCRELADECRREGVGLGFYYSHTLDWHEKNGAGNFHIYSPEGVLAQNRNSWDFPDANIDFSEYFYKKCLPQVKELLTSYGPLELMWFDFPHDITPEQSRELRDTVKSIQPSCLINSRIGHGMQDYYSLGDNALPDMPHGLNIECLVTMNHTWGYRKDDGEWKSPEEMIGILTRNLAAGATMLLNVGPMGDGSLTEETYGILAAMGEFTRKNAEAIYGGVEPNPFPSLFDFGRIAKGNKKLYFYMNGKKETASVSGLSVAPSRIYLAGEKACCKFTYSDGILTFSRLRNDGTLPVYVADFDSEFEISSVPRECDNKLSLHVSTGKKARISDKDTPPRAILYTGNRTSLHDGLALSNTDMLTDWTDKDEYLILEGELLGGEYEAELVHAHSFSGDEPELLPLTVKINGEAHRVGKEKFRTVISRTGNANTHITRTAGFYSLKKGPVRVIIETEDESHTVPAIELRLVRIAIPG